MASDKERVAALPKGDIRNAGETKRQVQNQKKSILDRINDEAGWTDTGSQRSKI